MIQDFTCPELRTIRRALFAYVEWLRDEDLEGIEHLEAVRNVLKKVEDTMRENGCDF